MTQAELLFSVSWIQPELLLAGYALLATLLGAFAGARVTGVLSGLAALTMVAAGVLALLHSPDTSQTVFNGAMQVDAFSAYAKALIAFAAAATLLLGADHFARIQDRRFEFPILTVLAVLGMFVMVSANDLITLYVGLELQSLSAYVLAAWRRDDARSSEAGLKYFVLGALSSGLLLYGCSFVYGFAGSVSFDAIAAAIVGGEAGVGMIFGLVLVLSGLAFKMSAAPFHMWTPDVYEGAPTPVTALFAAAPKAAAVVLMARVLYEPFAGLQEQWQQVIAVLAGASMLVGAFAGLVQTNLKRLLAYSSIMNMGFVLMGLAAGVSHGPGHSAGATSGPESALVYLALYLPASIGVFALMLTLRNKGEALERVDDLSGLGQRHVGYALLMTVLIFSLIGIPPLAGFFGKLAVFRATLDAGLWPLAVIGAIAAVVGAGYYLRVLARIWFAPVQVAAFQPVGAVGSLTAVVAAALSFPILVVLLSLLEQGAKVAIATSF
jgi:NADH-quinone oxidoreductase subunit N